MHAQHLALTSQPMLAGNSVSAATIVAVVLVVDVVLSFQMRLPSFFSLCLYSTFSFPQSSVYHHIHLLSVSVSCKPFLSSTPPTCRESLAEPHLVTSTDGIGTVTLLVCVYPSLGPETSSRTGIGDCFDSASS